MTHYLSICTLLIIVLIVISARSAPPSKSPVNHRLCPEEYRELRRRQAEASAEWDDDDDDDDVNEVGEGRESICEKAMDIIGRHRNIAKLNPSLLLYYCPHYGERLALVRENNTTLCENKKRDLKRKRDDDSIDSDDDDDYNKRHALRRRELKKRFALRFIRKRMS